MINNSSSALKTSPNDKKRYQTLTLENGLRVVLVEDLESHKSACSLAINSGSFDDPVDRPGFAHFIEHMLFNGNQKFPTPNAINEFISQHGGNINAWTATEHSNFYFDIRPEHFDEALEQFCHLFIDPLFTDEALSQEQTAIHSEYKLKLQDDSRRIQQVHKETCNPAHPFHKFSVGNRHTLSDLPQRPVKEELISFWNEHYQANYMTLCIVSNQPIEQITPLVTELFSQISVKKPLKTKPAIKEPLYLDKNLGQFIVISPVKELHKLNITFAMPEVDQLYKSKMVSFIAHIIGHEGDGSLFELLKDKGLVNSFGAGHGISGNNFKDFNLSFELTALGENNIEDILQYTFSYIGFLKQQTPENYLYEEQQRLTDVSFTYQESIKPIKLANQIVLNMQHYPEEDYLAGDFRMDGLDLTEWTELFNYFSAKNMRITLVSQNSETDRQAHWYHTPYSVNTIPSELLDELDQQDFKGYDFKLPAPNPYLDQVIKLEHTDFNSNVPINIDEAVGWRCWFKQDVSFRVPKGNIFVGLDLPHVANADRTQAMMRLFCDLFMDTISEQHYQAEMAGLHYNVYAHNAGITLYTSGLSNNQHKLLLNLASSMLTCKFNESRFEEVRRQLLKHWRNAESSKPINQLFSQLNEELVPSSISTQVLANNLSNVTFSEFIEFHQNMFKQIFSEVFIYGNWNASQATDINDQIKQILSHSEFVTETDRCIKSIANKSLIKVNKTIKFPDSAAVLYIQGQAESEQNFVEKAIFILVSQMLAPFAFSYLRQEQKLGYLAGSGYMPMSDTPGLAIYVQSHDYQSDFLADKLNDCLQHFIVELEGMSEQEFNHHVVAVSHQYKEQANNLNQKCQQLWISIGNKDYEFNHKQKIVKELAALKATKIIEWAKSKLYKDNLSGLLLMSKNA